MAKLFTPKGAEEVDVRYTAKIAVPQYVPRDCIPHISSLTDYRKYSQLLADINNSTVTDEEKKFLRLAASRHIVFNYANCADYYAHATPEMQRLMEQSALVILDVNDAIANGYVKLSKDVRAILERSGEIAGEK